MYKIILTNNRPEKKFNKFTEKLNGKIFQNIFFEKSGGLRYLVFQDNETVCHSYVHDSFLDIETGETVLFVDIREISSVLIDEDFYRRKYEEHKKVKSH